MLPQFIGSVKTLFKLVEWYRVIEMKLGVMPGFIVRRRRNDVCDKMVAGRNSVPGRCA